MKIIELGPQYILRVYLCRVETVPYGDMFHKSDSAGLDVDTVSGSEKLAREFLDAFQGHISVADMEAIYFECARRITEHWRGIDNFFIGREEKPTARLEEPIYKLMKQQSEKL